MLPLVIAVLGLGTLVMLLRHGPMTSIWKDLATVGIEESTMTALWAANARAEQSTNIAETTASVADPAAPRLLQEASRSNQLVARKTAEFATVVDRAAKTVHAPPTLSVVRDEVARISRDVTFRDQRLAEIRKALPHSVQR